MSYLGKLSFPFSSMLSAAKLPGVKLPGVTHVNIGFRFLDGWYQSQVQRMVKPSPLTRVLLPGCDFNSREVRDWAAQPVKAVQMLDIVDWGPSFNEAKTQLQSWYRPELGFVHGTLDSIPLESASYDLMISRAVLEHVGNMEDSVREMARVLKPGGFAVHNFGPLYFTFGGDHTIGYYGFEHGFDHVLLDEAEYRKRISDGHFYERLSVEADHSRYWALQGIFSYLRPGEYLEIFQRHFSIELCVAIVSEEALQFRGRHPELWRQMLDSGLNEHDLLIGSMQVLMKKPNGVAC